ncbi:hypothetical protein AGLY_002169 [Aphis glycines]|uniref:Uncharacterized protein n=1 Tax=Aphis glycines TaxID=307491 RepID=A0A6G0U419_APHGL|nr:hypothetical protein AGLY_002169 [Aphis glycines]
MLGIPPYSVTSSCDGMGTILIKHFNIIFFTWISSRCLFVKSTVQFHSSQKNNLSTSCKQIISPLYASIFNLFSNGKILIVFSKTVEDIISAVGPDWPSVLNRDIISLFKCKGIHHQSLIWRNSQFKFVYYWCINYYFICMIFNLKKSLSINMFIVSSGSRHKFIFLDLLKGDNRVTTIFSSVSPVGIKQLTNIEFSHKHNLKEDIFLFMQ